MQNFAEKFYQNGMWTNDSRVTGEMDVFIKTRQFVQKRIRIGYGKTKQLSFDEVGE